MKETRTHTVYDDVKGLSELAPSSTLGEITNLYEAVLTV